MVGDILKVLEEGRGRKSAIMRDANLSYEVMEKYLSFLIQRGLVEVEGGTYRLTEKGVKLLQTLDSLRELEAKADELINEIKKELY
jgi:predicted transcriptional regulator